MKTRLTALAMGAAIPAAGAHAGIFSGGEVGAITDNGTTTYELNVANSGSIFGPLIVDLDLNHTWVGDLTITLEHAGTSVTLLDRPGVPASTVGNGADLAGVYTFTNNADPMSWDPYEVAGAATGVIVTPGVYSVNNTDGTMLSDFIGLDVNGVWTLTISDGAAFDTGALNAWSFRFFPSPGATALFGVAALAASRRRR